VVSENSNVNYVDFVIKLQKLKKESTTWALALPSDLVMPHVLSHRNSSRCQRTEKVL